MRILVFIFGIIINFILCNICFNAALKEYRLMTPYGESLIPAFWLSVVGFPILYLVILIISVYVLKSKRSVSEDAIMPVLIAFPSSTILISISAFVYALYCKF
jgi:hypothetical protein